MPDWEKRYADATKPPFGNAPNNAVRYALARADFTARSALCLADGDGRNGRWLAGQGLEVTAVDLSWAATAQAAERDGASGVTCTRIAADLSEWTPATADEWESTFLIYLHCEREIRERAVRLAARHTAPGGWFIAEGFSALYGAGPRMGPDSRSLLYDPAEFTAWLVGFVMEEVMTGTIRLDEGERHQGFAQVVRVMARRAG